MASSRSAKLQRLGLAPVVDLPDPVGVAAAAGQVGVRLVLEQRVQVRERELHVAVDRDVGDLVLVDLRRVDVDVDDLAVLGELGELAGHAVVEAHAEGQQQVGLVDGVVGVDRAVHAEHVQGQVMVGREAAEAVHGQGDRDAGLLGELPQLRRPRRRAMTPPPA